MNDTRNGKIARLPKHVRNQLGRRLENGEPGKKLVKWLNGLPAVQEVLKEQFGGRPVSEQNLSEWKQRGYQDWLRHREACEKIHWLAERAEDLDEAADGMEISDRLGSILAAELAGLAVKLLEEVTDPRECWRQLQEILRALRHLRHEAHNGQRIQLQRERWEREVEREDEEDVERMKQENKKRLIDQCFATMQKPAMAKFFGGDKNGEILAEYLHRIKFDLPLEGLIDVTELSGKTHPNGIKPNPTQSNPIKPDQTQSNHL